ncbi:hypothetical protein WJX73_003045 [Symbiochloris irregularis]|uniref:Hypervirulence associated protein TUDOR domain-containing protein n=1 Tax=Symbiochloris irregularis TaxID=706552 RepID=A0AAW1NME1_9CHLO
MAGDKPEIPEKGDEVSWKWGGGRPGGTVSDVKGEETTIESKGKPITKKGTEDNPAVVVERSGNNVVKRASELDVEK